jgi:hypothetical protein
LLIFKKGELKGEKEKRDNRKITVKGRVSFPSRTIAAISPHSSLAKREIKGTRTNNKIQDTMQY